MLGEYRRHFRRFYAHPANFDLIVETPENFKRTIGSVATCVPCEVNQVLCIVTKWIFDKSLLAFFWSIDITQTAERRPQNDLAGLVDATQPVVPGKNQSLGVRYRPAHRLNAGTHLSRHSIKAFHQRG